MKAVSTLCLLFFLSLPVLAQDKPSLTGQGLEDYRIGAKAPAKSNFPGLTHLEQTLKIQEEGETIITKYLKFFQNGRYLGKARLDSRGIIDELRIVSPEVRHEAGYAVGDAWSQVARVFPMGKLYYTYVSDWLFIESKSVGHLQLHFDKKDYRGKKELRFELQELDENDLSNEAKLRWIRIYLAPVE